ncbi:MAG: hypothetical protein ACFCVH_07810 [Alphaproteobacteria bacterium]
MGGVRAIAAAAMLAAMPAAALADGVIGTVEGELPFEGLYVKDVAALNVTAFRASMTIDFRKVDRIEFVEIDPETQVATIRVTFLDSYAMPATFSVAENAPWVAIGAYGRANYTLENLLNGDVQYIQFVHQEGEVDDGGQPESDTGG